MVYQNLDDLTNLLINLAVKARAEKYGIPNDVSNDIPYQVMQVHERAIRHCIW